MDWGIKKGVSLFLSGLTMSFTVDKYDEIKETTAKWSNLDRKKVNKIITTGKFELPDDDQEEEKKPDSDGIAW